MPREQESSSGIEDVDAERLRGSSCRYRRPDGVAVQDVGYVFVNARRDMNLDRGGVHEVAWEVHNAKHVGRRLPLDGLGYGRAVALVVSAQGVTSSHQARGSDDDRPTPADSASSRAGAVVRARVT
jgi:hypothetical protein